MRTHAIPLPIAAAFLLILSGCPAAFASSPPKLSTPESVGFSSERLKRLDAVMERTVDEGQYPGVVALLARHGKVVYFRAFGKRDIASGATLEPTAVFRLASMSKPVTAAAMMLLYEEGKWSPQDPICKFIPEFTALKVYKGTDPYGRILLEDPVHPPTMGELMTHTAGFSYGLGPGAVDRLYRDEQDRSIFLSGSLHEMIQHLAKVPLLYQPGTRWEYSLSTDIQGYIIERLSGMTLPEFMKKRLFEPLGMNDTDFFVPEDKRGRLASYYKMDESHHLVEFDPRPWGYDYSVEPKLPQGGGGLVSTAPDYFRFAQMILNGGVLSGVRILAPQTIQLMISNHLPDSFMSENRGGGYEFKNPRPGLGFAFDGAAVTDPGKANVPMGKGSYFWGGATGVWFWIDPSYDIVFVGMVQRQNWGIQDHVLGLPPNLEELSRAITYQALLQPQL